MESLSPSNPTNSGTVTDMSDAEVYMLTAEASAAQDIAADVAKSM
jgi:hypothetical protein